MSTTGTPSGFQGRKARARTALRDALALPKKPDLVCLSHLRWDFVYQRPHHLMSRFARQQRVYFVEEPVFEPEVAAHLTLSITAEGVFVAVPHLPDGHRRRSGRRALREAPRPAAARLERLRALVLHADGARVHAAPRAGRRSSTTAWTSYPRSAGRRRTSSSARPSSSAPPTSSSPAATACYEAKRRTTRTSTRSRAASTSATSARRAACSASPPTRPPIAVRASASSA